MANGQQSQNPHPDPPAQDGSRLERLYQSLNERGVVRGLPDNFNSFQQDLSDPDRRKEFYNRLNESGIVRNLPEYDSFEEDVFQSFPATSPGELGQPVTESESVPEEEDSAEEPSEGERRLVERIGEEDADRFFQMRQRKNELEREQTDLLRKRDAATTTSGGPAGMPGVTRDPSLQLSEDENKRLSAVNEEIQDIDNEIGQLKPEGAGARMVDWASQFVQAGGEFTAGTLDAVALGAKGLDDLFGTDWQPGEVDEQSTAQLAAWMRDELEDRFPTDPTLQDEYMGKFFGALGSFLSYAGGGLASSAIRGTAARAGARAAGKQVSAAAIEREARRAAQGASTLAAAGGGASRMYREAKEMGAPEEDAKFAGYLGTVPGVIQVLPVLRVMRRFSNAKGGQTLEGWNRAVEALKTGGQESFVETLGQYGFDKIAQQVYDEDRDAFENLWDAMSTAGPAGAVSDFLLGAIGRRSPSARTPSDRTDTDQPQQPPPSDTPADDPSGAGQIAPETTFTRDDTLPPQQQVEQLTAEKQRLEEIGQSTPDAQVARDASQAIDRIDSIIAEQQGRIESESEQEIDPATPESSIETSEVNEATTTQPEPIPSFDQPASVMEGNYQIEFTEGDQVIRDDYQVETQRTPVVINNQTGDPVGRSSRNYVPALSEYLTRLDDTGKRVDTPLLEEGVLLDEGEYVNRVAQESESPTEILEAIDVYQSIDPNFPAILDDAISNVLWNEGHTITRNDLEQFADPAMIEGDQGRFYRLQLQREGTENTDLANLTQMVNDRLNTDYSTSDIMDHWLGYHDARRNQPDPTLRSLMSRFEEITGEPYSPRIAHEVARRQAIQRENATEQEVQFAEDIVNRASENIFDESDNIIESEFAQQIEQLHQTDPQLADYLTQQTDEPIQQQQSQQETIQQPEQSGLREGQEQEPGLQAEEGDTGVAQPPEQSAEPTEPSNRFVTRERFEEASRELNSRIQNRLSMGMDPKTFKLTAEVGLYYLETGARKFSDFVNRMVARFGERVRPYLGDVYNHLRKDPKVQELGINQEMNTHQEVAAFYDGDSTQFPGGEKSDGQQEGAYDETIDQDAAEGGSNPPPSSPNTVLQGQFSGGWDPSGASMTHWLHNSLFGWRQSFESASDRLRRTPGLAPLGEMVDLVFDREARNIGIFQSHMNEPIRNATRTDKDDFGRWVRNWDQQNNAAAETVYQDMSDEGKALADAWIEFTDVAGKMNQDVGTMVWDSQQDKMRPIGKLEQFFPRKIKDWVFNAIHARTRHPKDYARFVKLLIDQGKVKNEAEAQKYIRQHSADPSRTDDYFSALEHGRTEGFPADAYDYSLDTAIEYGNRWSKRLAQIEVLGQEGTKFGEVFKKVISQVQDPKLRRYLRRIRNRVYNESPDNPFGRMINTLNMLATGLQLGNFATSTQNWITGAGLNFVSFGNYAVKSARKLALVNPAERSELEEKGVWKDDLISVQHDLADSVPSLLSNFTGWTMKWGGYKITERGIRAHAYFAGKIWVRDFIQTVGKNPTTGKSKKFIAWLQRHNFDYQRLLAENGAGPYTDRVLRYRVNLPQGSYRVDMTPVFIDELGGRMVFKYRKYGTQVERMKWKDHIEPFMKSITGGERVTIEDPVSGQTVDKRAYDFVSMLRMLALPIVYGAANKWVRWTGYAGLMALAGPDWEDIEKALDDDERAKATSLALQMAWESMVMSGILGNLQTPVQWGRDVSELKSVANPLEPPNLGALKSTGALLQTMMDQKTLTAGDIDFWANRTFSFYRTFVGSRPSLQFQAEMGMDRPHLEFYRLERAETQKEVRRYAEDVGIPDRRRRGAGSFRSTPQTPINRSISDAIVLGRPEQARVRLRQYLETLDDDPEKWRAAVSSAKRHVTNRQPIVLGGQYSDENRINFLNWAEENLHPDKVERIKDFEDQYRETAKGAGFMTDKTPLEEREAERSATEQPEIMNEAQKNRLFRELMGID